jgi:DNA helicase HerA-like ATPase
MHISVLGYTGTGKSWYIKNNLLHNIKTKIIFFDIENEYHGKITSPKTFLKDVQENDYIRIVENDLNIINFYYDKIFKFIRNVTVVIDEAHRQGGEEHKLTTELKDLITAGRKRGIRLITASQTPSLISKVILKNSGILILKKASWGIDWKIYKQINEEAYNILRASPNQYATVVLKNGIIIGKENV